MFAMKQTILFIMLLTSCYLTTLAQNIIVKAREERAVNRIENRKSNDPIYATGDTLYLLYDAQDSLQTYDAVYHIMLWKMRGLTREEALRKDTSIWGEPFIPEIEYEFHLFSSAYDLPKRLTADDLSRMVVTTRKEFMDFYQREYERKNGMMKVLGKEEKMVLDRYEFRNHFSAIYIIIPQKNGKYKLYVNTEEDDDWAVPE